MIKKNSLLIIIFVSVFMISCSSSADDEIRITQYVEKMEFNQVLDEILLETSDIDQLSRVLKCTPSTIVRLKNKITIPTQVAVQTFKKTLICMKINGGRDYLDKVDPNNTNIIRQAKLAMFSKTGIIVGVVLLIVMTIIGAIGLGGVGFLGVILCWFLVFVLDYIASYFYTVNNLIDVFSVNINPIFEMLVK